ncbi:hypothetical protein STSP_01240 [Streptomyces jeddahensis]|uniref:Uncharacterized protein n=1 Tax=Streptomyces jeddahensis TaxID=1716141 RepID=A0A177I084_9ACTN|nr:hypothetical protein STSP_01240 [Streptomyces jeddahensis]
MRGSTGGAGGVTGGCMVGAGGVGGACTGAAGAGAWAGSSSTVTPKSVAIPARPFAYPWPTARAFHAPLRR